MLRLDALEEGTREYQYVRNTLIEMNLTLVRYVARRFSGRRESTEDMLQVGTIGLIKAIDRFVDGYMSANISRGNSTSRCSARNANTLPAGINARHVSQTSGPISSPAQSPCMKTSLAPRQLTGAQRPSTDF